MDDWLLAAVAENHRVCFRRVSRAEGAEVVRAGGAELFLGREPMAFPEGAVDVSALVAEVRARSCRSLGFWSLTENPRLGARLAARGFQWGWRPHWMALDLESGLEAAPPEGHVVEPARPPYAPSLPYVPTGPEVDGTFRLGVRHGGRIVGHLLVNPHAGVAGIYSMGVAPEFRRRGIARALTRTGCRMAADHGCRHVVLNATEEGALLYQSLAFRSLGWGQTWWYFRGPEPSPRQVALAEAVGLGDLEALEDLEPSREELQGRLPGGETPLSLALLTDAPASGEWLLRRHPTLAAARLEPHGGTLLHAAAEHDRPAFVELALAHGVDPVVRDQTFNATALGWAEHFGRRGIAERLARLGGEEWGRAYGRTRA